MADRAFIVDDIVQIDLKGCGTITEKVQRGFETFFMVKLTNTEYEFEVEAETEICKQFITEIKQILPEFIEQQSNRNTLSKITKILSKNTKVIFEEPSVAETRNLHENPVQELAPLLSRFFISVKKANGDDYEPSSLRGMLSSFDRQLRR